MVLEAVMICMDNSDHTRNGDYGPTRFDAQQDAVNLVCGTKTNQHPENSVGLLTCAGDRVEVLLTPTSDLGRIISELSKVQQKGSSDFLRAIQTAQLALKHRQNKHQKQRIIAFVGSPVMASEKELEMLGKNLKKNSVSLDLISFGEVEENAGKLEKLLSAVSSDTSHMIEVPVGPKLLSDVLLSSAIINPDGENMGTGGGGEGGDGFQFGINPNDDPELALALRISMEEERARQQQASPATEGAAAPEVAPAAPAAAAAAPAASVLPMASDAAVIEAMGMEDMDEELRQALLLSLQEADPPAAAPAAKEDVVMTPAPAAAAAPAAPAAPAAASTSSTESQEASDARWFQDPTFVSELLGSLPGVDIKDPRIQAALQEATGTEKKDGDKQDGDKK